MVRQAYRIGQTGCPGERYCSVNVRRTWSVIRLPIKGIAEQAGKTGSGDWSLPGFHRGYQSHAAGLGWTPHAAGAGLRAGTKPCYPAYATRSNTSSAQMQNQSLDIGDHRRRSSRRTENGLKGFAVSMLHGGNDSRKRSQNEPANREASCERQPPAVQNHPRWHLMML